VIVSTPAATTANSYVSVAQGDDFFAGEVVATAWTTATLDQKERALRSATTMIDGLDFIGQRSTTEQSLKWPRLVEDLDERLIEQTDMPLRLVRATCRLAYALLIAAPEQVFDAREIKSEKVGPIATEYFDGATAGVRIGLDLYPLVLTELAPLRSAGAQLSTVRA
jgi:hypothetical protein